MTKRAYTWTKGSRPLKDRILDKVAYEDHGLSTSCWIWDGATAKGYGSMMTGSRIDGSRKVRLTHIVAYEEWIGPVPEGLELDHLCHQTLCCNPEHLEPVTHAENCSDTRLRPGVAEARNERWKQYQPMGPEARRLQ